MTNMFNLKNQVAMVTGAAGNLGKAAADGFIAAGAHTILIDRSTDRLNKIFPEISNSKNHFLATSVNSLEEEALNRAVNHALEKFGRIDILINSVGGYYAGPKLHETPMERWDFMFDLNVRTAFIASRSVIPTMLKQKRGVLINIGSRSGLKGSAKSAAYSASKSALMRMTESMSAELKFNGINVNCVLPGVIDTPQNRKEMPGADFSKWVTPKSLADVILFLSSEGGKDIHGASIPVYGLS